MNRTELPAWDIDNHCGLIGHLQCGFGQPVTFQKILHADAQITMAKSVNEEVGHGVELINDVSGGDETDLILTKHQNKQHYHARVQ
jgi:hypothetical protein